MPPSTKDNAGHPGSLAGVHHVALQNIRHYIVDAGGDGAWLETMVAQLPSHG